MDIDEGNDFAMIRRRSALESNKPFVKPLLIFSRVVKDDRDPPLDGLGYIEFKGTVLNRK